MWECRKQSYCSAHVQAEFSCLLLSCPYDPQIDLQQLLAGSVSQIVPWTLLSIYMVKASKSSEEKP